MSSNKSILLKTIKLSNFGTYKAQEMHFHGGVTIITGPNGVGKSLLLDAIRLAFGLHARSVRMDKIENYIMQGADKATIEILLSNPEVNGGYYLKSNNPEFNQLFLGNEVVQIRRTIPKKGGSFFSIKKESGWVRLDSTKRQALQEVYLQIGLTPTDELNFITGEDYSNIMKENPHKRFEILSTKLGLNRIQADYEEVRQRLDHNQNKKTELESNLKIAEETSKALEEKFKQFREMEENEENRTNYENELFWVPINRRKNKIEQMGKETGNLKAEISETMLNIANLQNQIEKQKSEIDTINKEYNKSKTKLDDLKGEIAGSKAVITQKRDDIITIRSKIKNSEETIAKKKLEKSNLEKEIKLLERKAKGISPETIATKNELEEEIKRVTNEINVLEQEVQKMTDLALEEIIRSEEQLKTEIKETHMEKSEVRKELFQKGQQTQLYDKSVRDFFQLLSSNGFSEEIYGPVSAVCKIKREHEDWRTAIETAIGKFNSYFITDSKQAYKEIIKIRKSNPSFSNIPLGFVKKGKGQSISIPDNEVIYNSILGTIQGPRAVEAFLSDNAGKTLLIHDQEDLNIDGLMQAKGRVFLSKSLLQYRTGHRTLRSESASPIRRYKGAPLGTPLDRAVKIEEHPQIITLEKKISEFEQKLKALRTKKNNIRDQPEIRRKIEEIIRLRDEKLPDLRNQLSKTEESIREGDSSLQLKVLNNKKESLISFIRGRDNQISDWKSEIIENEKQIANLSKKVEPFNSELRKYESESNNRLKIQRDMEKHLTRKESHLSRHTQTLKNVKVNLDNLEQRIFEEKDKLKEEEEEINRKKIQKPSTIRPEAELKGRIAELTRNINKKRASGISSADEEKFLQHKEFISSLRDDIGKSLKEYEKLLTELMNWRGKWENAFDESIIKVEKSFDEILQALGASGRIEIANRDNPQLAQAFFWTKFGEEEEREIQHHSSGQQQAALVALIISLQSQSSSPITAIDEFDKGLDTTVKASLVDIIPKLVSTAVGLREEFQTFPIEQQFFVILPDVDPDLVTHDVNFYSIFKTNISSAIQEI